MPRRKASERNEPVLRRARTGCKACRSRKIRCDEAKPQCGNCSKRGLACDTGLQLKWHTEYASRGLAFGRMGVWTKDPGRRSNNPPQHPVDLTQWCGFPTIRHNHFINTLCADFEPSSSDQRTEVFDATDYVYVTALANQTRLLRNPSAFPNLVVFDTSLVEYYILRFCPLTTSSYNSKSPFEHLVLPLFGSSGLEDVIHSVMALSARYRSTTDAHWLRAAMSLKGKALTSLRRRLALAEDMVDGMWDPQILVIMMFLCLYEIVDNCDHRWVVHLKASQEIIRRKKGFGESPVLVEIGDLTKFAERFFAFQDVVSRTACGNPPLFGAEYWDNDDQKTQADSWMGCSPRLVAILSRISELGSAAAVGLLSMEVVAGQLDVLESELESMRSSISPGGDDLASSAELKRISALLYLHCVLNEGSPTNPLIARLVKEIMRTIYNFLRDGRVAGLAFPVFVAAVELDPIDPEIFHDDASGESVYGRRLILEVLDAMSRGSLSNTSRTRAVIRKVWRLRDLQAESESISRLPTAKSGHVNDWNLIVGPNSLNISLA